MGRPRLLTLAASGLGHVALLAALLSVYRTPPTPPLEPEPEPVTVQLVELPPPPLQPQPAPLASASPAPPTPAPPAPPKPAPAKVAPRRILARRAPVSPDVAPLLAETGPADDGPELSDAQIAGAATAGSGPAGRPCDMAQRLQAALRKDPQVRAAVADAHRAGGVLGKPLFVWNGDWIRSRGQDGDGLAAVREAIMWEIAFAPKACRAEPVHGLVLLALNDSPGAERLVVGSGAWRWSDLLSSRSATLGETTSRP